MYSVRSVWNLVFFMLLVFALLSFSKYALAATYYISPSGSDTTGSGSTTNPWATLSKAFASMVGGDTLIVKDGTYVGANNRLTDQGGYIVPPVGSASAWTVIKAEHDGQAVFDGENTRNMFDYEPTTNGNRYWQFEGLIWCRSAGSTAVIYHSSYIKFLRCGAYDAGDGNTCNFGAGNGSSYVLYENCYAWGSGRYKFLTGSTNHVILRQCVGRLDRVNAPTEPSAVFAIYGASDVEVQNCIAIDSDQTAYYSASEYDGGFFVPSTSGNANRINFLRCLGLNNTLGGITTTGNSSYAANDVTFQDCVVWDAQTPSLGALCMIRGLRTRILNCTFGDSRGNNPCINSYDGIGYNNDTTVKNTIIVNYTGNTEAYAMNDVENEGYSSLFGNWGTVERMTLSATSKTTINPLWNASTNPSGALKYITRVESGSTLSGQGEAGADIGANCTKMIGKPGTLWGEAGYNVEQATNMWPFPNEDLIRAKMKVYNAGGVSGNRGFCADGTTLTKYIWEYTGNTMPADVYGSVPPANNQPVATASANPTSGTAPLTVNFTGSGTDSDGTIAAYAWNFGDGATSSQQNPSHIYNTAGSYTAQLTVTDNGGATGSRTVGITVSPAQAPQYEISGYVRDGASAGMSGVSMSLSGGASATATTDSNGYYRFGSLAAGAGYTVTPSRTGYAFSPVSVSTNSLNGNLTNRNFAGSPVVVTYYIAGYVRNAGGTGISGTTLTITGSASGTTTSDANGYYRFSGLPENGDFVITAAKAGYAFSPASITKTGIGSNQEDRNFTGTALYSISGYARTGGGTAINGVTMTLSGGASGTATTDVNGYYQFANLAAGGNYTITPARTGFTFSPVSISASSLAGNLTNRNFTGTAEVTMFVISGFATVTSGEPLGDVTVLLSGDVNASVTTTEQGYFEFANLPPDGSYTVTSSKSNYLFTPVEFSTGALSNNWNVQPFTAVPLRRVQGYVRDSNGKALSDVTVTLAGSAEKTAVTDQNGFYRFIDLEGARDYALTPQKSGWKFSPTVLSIDALTADKNDGDFSGIRSLSVKGRVKDGSGKPIKDATVSLNTTVSAAPGAAAGNVITRSARSDGNGIYAFTDVPESAMVTILVQKAGCSFTPESRSIAALVASVDDWDFVAENMVELKNGQVQVVGSTERRGIVNPDQGDTARIHFRTTGNGRIDCRVFTLSGEMIWCETKENVDEGFFEWIPGAIASGNYLVQVKGPGINVKKKISVLR